MRLAGHVKQQKSTKKNLKIKYISNFSEYYTDQSNDA